MALHARTLLIPLPLHVLIEIAIYSAVLAGSAAQNATYPGPVITGMKVPNDLFLVIVRSDYHV